MYMEYVGIFVFLFRRDILSKTYIYFRVALLTLTTSCDINNKTLEANLTRDQMI